MNPYEDNWSYGAAVIPEETEDITSEVLLSWKANVKALPIDEYLVPIGGSPLQNVSDEALLTAPPHLIAHLQRTAAQGGLQVISPRQTPMSCMMIAREGTKNFLGDHNVGSIAEPHPRWPSMWDDEEELERLLPDEPLAPVKEEHYIREKTRTVSLVKSSMELADPVLACLVKGRAIIDILKRPDVAGGADEMAELLAAAWGVTVEDIMDLEAYTLGVEGPLQRHAMKSDEVYPVMYAPVQCAEVISCGVSDLSKQVLLPDTAIDWRRTRVMCEAVFYNACVLEGLPIRYMRGACHPADPGGGANKPGTMTFYPAPGIAWSYSPTTFSLCPDVSCVKKRTNTMPPDVRLALQLYIEKVRPVSALLDDGWNVATWASIARPLGLPQGETLAGGYEKTMSMVMVGSARGKRAHAAVRNAIYNVFDQAPVTLRVRMARYLKLAQEEAEVQLGEHIVPDVLIDDIARRFSEVGSFVRVKLALEAGLRGHTIEEWWEDLISQIPARMQKMKEGTLGWAKASLWLLFRESTEKWANLNKAISMNTLREIEKDAIGAVELPPTKGSAERLLAVVEHAVKGITVAYASYYMGVADIGMALSRAAEVKGMSRRACVLREGAYLWVLRARAFRGINAHLIAHDKKTPSKFHKRIKCEPVDVLLKPAPYRAFIAWRAHLDHNNLVAAQIKKHFKTPKREQITDYFKTLERPILVGPESTVTRYLLDPQRLGLDIERAWMELVEDLVGVIDRFCGETAKREEMEDMVEAEYTSMGEMMEHAKRVETHSGGISFFDLIMTLNQDEAMGITDQVESMPEHICDEIFEGRYNDIAHLLSCIRDGEELMKSEQARPSDVVR